MYRVKCEEAIKRLRDSQTAVLDNLHLLVQCTQVECYRKYPTGRDRFKQMLIEVFDEYPAWTLQIAKDMAYNITSVRRWHTTDSCPHQALWPQVFRWLEKRIDLELAKL